MKKAHWKLLFISFIMIACKGKNTHYNEYTSYLLRQRISNSSKVIYKYTDSGTFATSNIHSGTFILDSTETINQSKLEDLLPLYYIGVYPNSNIIDAIKLVHLNDKSEEEGTYEQRVNSTLYRVKKFYTKQGSNLAFFYNYRHLAETEDSIFFEQPSVDGFGLKLPDNIGFRKGNITVTEDSCGFVSEIKLTILNQYPLWEQIKITSDTLCLDQTFTGEDQIHLAPLSLVYCFNLLLKPDSLSKKQKISDYGVYKQVK